MVKGGSWDDFPGVTALCGVRHGRPLALKHILIGFRCSGPGFLLSCHHPATTQDPGELDQNSLSSINTNRIDEKVRHR